MTDDRWLSVNEIAAHLGVKRDTIYKRLTRCRLPAHKAGRLWKFHKDEVLGTARKHPWRSLHCARPPARRTQRAEA